ncbi:MAG: hypothetical protein Q8K96_13950 [Rubrivivax sp.]|nr:hypothetical protein [Rubrivivax sp.]
MVTPLALPRAEHRDGVARLCLAHGVVRSAVERQLEIVGEACRRTLEDAPELRQRRPESALAVAMRNRISHGDDGVDSAVACNAVRTSFPPWVRNWRGSCGRIRCELNATAGAPVAPRVAPVNADRSSAAEHLNDLRDVGLH